MFELTQKQKEKYIRTWRDDPEDARLEFAIFRASKKYRAFFYADKAKLVELFVLEKDEARRLEIVRAFLNKIKELFRVNAECLLDMDDPTLDAILYVLDPSTDIQKFNEKGLDSKVWPWLMFSPGMVGVAHDEVDNIFWYEEPMGGQPTAIKTILPHERIYKVDHRKKKEDLQQRFKEILDFVSELPDAPKPSRSREEMWRNLRIYMLRDEKRMTYGQIADELGIRRKSRGSRPGVRAGGIDTVKDGYRAARKAVDRYDGMAGDLPEDVKTLLLKNAADAGDWDEVQKILNQAEGAEQELTIGKEALDAIPADRQAGMWADSGCFKELLEVANEEGVTVGEFIRQAINALDNKEGGWRITKP